MIEAVIFDMDGVLVSTDEYHYQSWCKLARDYGIDFDHTLNNRLRGLRREECVTIFVNGTPIADSQEKQKQLSHEKNAYYLELLKKLSSKDILPGVSRILQELQVRKIKLAVGSSSRNSAFILERIGLKRYFEVCVDGNHVSAGKPDPEIFLQAAEKLGVIPQRCLVIEDGEPGIEAALAADMKVLGVGKSLFFRKVITAPVVLDLTSIGVEELLGLGCKQ